MNPTATEVSLAEALPRVDRLRCGEAVAVFAPLADTLAALHAEDTAHGGLVGDRVRLSDGGTVSLDPPVRGHRGGRRAQADDVRALGTLIVGALLGAPPPDDTRPGDTAAASFSTGWMERAFALGVPAGLVTVLAAALTPEARRRPAAREVATALRETCGPLPLDRLLTADRPAPGGVGEPAPDQVKA